MTALFDSHHLHSLLLSVLRTSAWLAITIVLFAPLELLFAVRKEKFFHVGWATNLGWYFVNSLITVALLAPPLALLATVVHAVLPAGFTSAAASLPLWARMIAAMVVGEIGFYWGHRWSHESPLLWRFHAVHHSAEHMNFLVNTRAHPVDMLFTRLCGMVLLFATGLASTVGSKPDLVPMLVLLIGTLWSFFIHANLRWRLGPLEWLLSSPAFHHWHHTRDDHQDHNYASMLPVFDRIFGTHYVPRHWPDAYGTATPMPASLTGQLVDPFVRRAPAPSASAPALRKG